MTIVDVINYIISFIELFTNSIFLFASGFQWGFNNIAIVFNSFLSLYSFVSNIFMFLSSFLNLFPTWLLPFPFAVFIYWLIMFVIKLGGKS